MRITGISNVEAYYGAQIREFHMGLHSHPRCEIMYVVDGECWVEARERRGKAGAEKLCFSGSIGAPFLNVDSGSPCTLLNLNSAVPLKNSAWIWGSYRKKASPSELF